MKKMQKSAFTTTLSNMFTILKKNPTIRRAFIWFLTPLAVYTFIFFLFQPLYITNFSNGFFLDNGDGFQNVWNIWWVDHALIEQQTNPYFTNMLHWPEGVSLVPQTMNIINGLIAIPLMNVFGFSLIESTNFAVVAAFISAGITMFWFIMKLYKRYWIAIIAGGLYTFSSYHFAHAQGHLQLVTLQFVPLFLLAFWVLLEKLKYRYAFLAALSLFLVLLSDYYYLFWSIMLGGLWFIWCLITKKIKLSIHLVKVMATFTAIAAALILPLVYSLVHLSKNDPLAGSHNATQFSLDPVSIVMPGGSWVFHELTDFYTTHIQYFAEASVFFGFGVITVLIIAFIKKFIRKDKKIPSWLNFWWIILILFGLLALGPRLQIAGHIFEAVPLPYAFLEKLVPTLEISGMPMRWIFVALIAAIVIVSYMLTTINLKRPKGKILLAAFVLVSFIDLWPRQLPLTDPGFRPYVSVLKQLPYGSVVDNGALTGSEALYNQTFHNKPIAFGYVTRTTKSVDERDFHLFAAIEENRIDTVCKDFKVRYFTIPKDRQLDTHLPIIYDDGDTLIYDLKNDPNC